MAKKDTFIRSSLDLFKGAIERYGESNAHDLGAALAYFAIFSIIPLLTILIMLTGIFFGNDLVQSHILSAFHGILGTDASSFLETTLVAGRSQTVSLWGSIFGGVVLIVAGILITTQLQGSLDRIFGYENKKISFFRMIREKIASFGIVFLLAILLLTFLLISSGVSFFGAILDPLIPFNDIYLRLINFVLNFLFIFGFTVINFRFLPRIKLSWKAILEGGIVTSILFILGKFLLGLYIHFSHPGSGFGAAGVLLVLLLWIYYSAQILFFGASFTYAREKMRQQEKS